jgi:hypothetical protein
MKERTGSEGESITLQMVNLSGFMGCKPAQASAVMSQKQDYMFCQRKTRNVQEFQWIRRRYLE